MFRPHIGAPVHSAIWCLVVGPSGIGRKSTCVRLATDLLLEVDPNLVGNQPDSAEGLMEEVAASPQTTLVYSELGEFLAKTQPGSRQEGQRTLQTALYDGVTMTRRLARRTVTIEHPRLTILGGVSDTYLERYTRDEDYTGGYMSRFALFGGVSEHDPEGTGDPETAARLRHSLLVRLPRVQQASDRPQQPDKRRLGRLLAVASPSHSDGKGRRDQPLVARHGRTQP